MGSGTINSPIIPHARADVETAFQNAPEEAQLVLIQWDGTDRASVRAQDSARRDHLEASIPFLLEALNESRPKAGSLLVSMHDAMWWPFPAPVPVLAFGKRISDETTVLIPDPQFLTAHGRDEVLREIEKFDDSVPWEAKIPGAFWRGASTGVPPVAEGTWRENPRIRLAAKSLECGDPLLLDAYISEVQAFDTEETKREIVEGGYVKDPVRYVLFGRHRYLIDIDGNASSWGLFWKLSFSGVVLKVESDFMQWYYPELAAGVHFIPVKRDLSDLVEKILWARAHDAECREMGRGAREVIRQHSISSARRQTGIALTEILQAQR